MLRHYANLLTSLACGFIEGLLPEERKEKVNLFRVSSLKLRSSLTTDGFFAKIRFLSFIGQ
jgi:hypothetical protein